MNNNFFTPSKDKTILNGYCWNVPSNPVAIVFIVHGLGGHAGRFSDFANSLNKRRIAVVGIDLRGHGLSQGKRGHVATIQDFLSDIEAAIAYGRKCLTNDIPMFLFGNSMGGTLVLEFILNTKQYFSGVILTAPWFTLSNKVSEFKVGALQFLNFIAPAFTISTGIKSEHLRSENSNSERIDELVHKRISARVFVQVSRLGAKLIRKKLEKLITPILLFHGLNDPVTSFMSSKRFCELNRKYATLVTLSDVKHEVHMDVKGDELINYIEGWIKDILNDEFQNRGKRRSA